MLTVFNILSCFIRKTIKRENVYSHTGRIYFKIFITWSYFRIGSIFKTQNLYHFCLHKFKLSSASAIQTEGVTLIVVVLVHGKLTDSHHIDLRSLWETICDARASRVWHGLAKFLLILPRMPYSGVKNTNLHHYMTLHVNVVESYLETLCHATLRFPLVDLMRRGTHSLPPSIFFIAMHFSAKIIPNNRLENYKNCY